MSSLEKGKRKKKRWLRILFGLILVVFLAVAGVVALPFLKEKYAAMQNGQTAQNSHQNSAHHSNIKVDTSFLEIFKKEDDKESEWVIEGDAVSIDLLYGYYLPMHCSSTEIANVDVVTNMFEDKTWSTYLSPSGKTLTLSALPLLWNGSKVDISLISKENLENLNETTGYPHGLAGTRSYKAMIQELFPEYGFTTVTYYDAKSKFYAIDCAYTVDGNDMTLLMIHFDAENRQYSLIPMEKYQVIREENEIIIYKDKNFVSYVPYNLCENASMFEIEAFAKYKNERYENIIGFTYQNANTEEEKKPSYGCIYFADGSKALEAVFDFSKENELTIRWEKQMTDYYGAIVEIEGSGELTFSYKIVRDTGLILEKDGIEYYYLQKQE